MPIWDLDVPECGDVGGNDTCDTRCTDEGKWNYWHNVLRVPCDFSCQHACGFRGELEPWYAEEQKNESFRINNSPYRDCPEIIEKINHLSKEEQSNYIAIPGGVGIVHRDHITVYRGEEIIDLDAIILQNKTKPTCSFYEKTIFGEE